MTNKKKQSAVVVAATVMSITSVLSPVAAVYAADAETAIVQQTGSTEIRENALPVTLPQELSGNDGQVLQDIDLPDGWSWTDGNTIISRDKPEYPARITVDDKTYDYSAVEGYNAEEHFVEKNIPVTVLVPETEESTALSAKEQVQAPQTDSISSNTGEIEINPTSTEAGENAPLITLPQELSGNDGQALQDIALPDGWSWTDGNTIISRENPEYPARIAVDDKTYDYSAVEGYNAEEHFVEKNIPVTVLVPETEESTALSSKEQVQAPQANSISSNTGKVEINPTDFPDEKFREYLLDTFNGDGENKIAIADVTLIDVSDRTDIMDLKGIEKFTDLKYLYCSYTGIQALDVSNNTNLRILNCYDTGIQALDVSKNSALTELYCFNTGIQALDVSKNLDLTYLDCSDTGIQVLDVSNNTLLKQLYCFNTGIQALDVSKNSALTELYCSGTGIQVLDVSKNTLLKQLYCYNTKIQALDLSNNTLLEDMDCSYTGIQVLDLSNNTALIYLYCDYNSNLISLYCGNTEIQALDVSNNTALTYLYCSYTGIQTLDVSNNTALTYLYCNNTKIQTLDVSKNTKLEQLNCSYTGIQALDVSKNTKLEQLYCYNTGIQALDVSENTALIYLYCYNTKIQTLDVRKNTKLEQLNCSYTGIQALDVRKNTKLEQLNCSYTGIQALDVSENTALIYLYCYNTKIQTLDVRKNTKLEQLDCSYTGIQVLDVRNNTKLEYLSCSDTEIQALNVRNNTALRELYCFSTEIQALDVRSNTKLEYLSCSSTEIQTLDVRNNTLLEHLSCSDTKIKALDVSNSPDLKYLDTRSTNLAYLDWGTADLSTWDKASSTIDLTVTGDTFDITKKFAGIDISKLTVISGGRLDGNNITDYKVGTPIKYTYACGNVNGSSDTLTVTLNLSKSVSKIEITSNPDMTYTGNPVANPSVDPEGSTGEVNYTYEIWNGRTWDEYTGIPTNAGKYRVTAKLAVDDFYNGAEDTKEFTISQATNGWIESLAMAGWTYGEKAVSPTAKAKFGNAIFTYSDSEKGPYTDAVPTDAGTWYVKSAVTGTDNYTALETTKEFTISQAANGWTENLAMTGWTYGEKAVSPTAKTTFGNVIFTYSDSEDGTYTDTIPTDAGTWYVKAAVAGTDNYTGVETTKEFTISQATNGWTENLSMTGWTYGEKAVSPTAKAKFGNVIFTYSDSEDGTYTDTIPTDAGTWYVKAAVAGTDNYAGVETTLAFTITPKSIDNNSQIVIPDIKSDQDVENLVIKDGDKELKKGTDYDVSKKQDGSKVTVTITFKGNYTGTVTRTYTVENKKPSDNTDTKKPSDSTKKDENGAVQTGDTTTTGLWAMLMGLSAGTVALLKSRKRKKETEE